MGDVNFTLEAIDKASPVINKLGIGFKDLASALIGPISGMAALTGAIKLAGDAMAAAAEEESNMASMNATIASMGLSSKISGENIRTMTEAMQAANGVFAHDDLEQAAQSFLRIESFDPSNLKQALSVVQDFAAGSGQSATSAANAIATALETGQTRSLKFSAAIRTQIQDMIKAGDSGGALSLIMDTLNSKWGGQASAQLDTYNGKVKVLKNNFGELLATAGNYGLGGGKGIVSSLNDVVIGYTKYLIVQDTFLTKAEVGIAKIMVGYENWVFLLTGIRPHLMGATKELDDMAAGARATAGAVGDISNAAKELNIMSKEVMQGGIFGGEGFQDVDKNKGSMSDMKNVFDDMMSSFGAGDQRVRMLGEAFGYLTEQEADNMVRLHNFDVAIKAWGDKPITKDIILKIWYEQFAITPEDLAQNPPPSGGGEQAGFAGGGRFKGWAMVGDAPGGGRTPYTEWVYAPKGAVVFNQSQMSGQSASPLAGGGIMPPASDGPVNLSDDSIRRLADSLQMAILRQ
jgi:hypothetical protein